MWERLKFLWVRINGKKTSLLIVLTIILTWIFVPTGDPSDIATIFLIKVLGIKLFLIIGILLIAILLCNRRVRRMFKKPTKSEVERICKRISDSKTAMKRCVMENA